MEKPIISAPRLNLKNNKSSVKNINISNSLFDALDIDFSNIKIENVNIKNAKNDCLDFSAGTYEIENLIAQYLSLIHI